MRDRPRTCPSMRASRVRQVDFAVSLILARYPHRVYMVKPKRGPGPVAKAAWRSIMNAEVTGQRHHTGAQRNAPAPEFATDPVCGMTVDPVGAKHTAEHAGRRWYFCSARCRERFGAEPNKYLAGKAPAPTPAPAGTVYTCPMHPQVRQLGPGFCPICGMALEPAEVEAEVGPNAELIDMRRRFWIGLVLTLPVVVLEMGGHLTG